ncbi:hypothetical protein [Rhizobium halophytocola]|uniref:Porin n=1 Tax=Rhizobium halophytocola TaxID=735519 RepID=A0ABS4DWI2_9HYPH|nr:hypothetical protein [Rhizobium halophytocola]MBP1850058.1 hypothetical protein [Rhizobium halophytocola]
MTRPTALLRLTFAAFAALSAGAPAFAYTMPQDISSLIDLPRPSAPLNYSHRVIPCIDGRETKIWINGVVVSGRCYAKALEIIRS